MLVPIAGGALLAVWFTIGASRRRGGELRVFALGLAAAALIYLGLALRSGDPRWLLIESAGVVLFGAVAWAGRTTAWLLAVGWLVHLAWDVGLHLDRAQPVVGAWYPLLCVGFDLLVAGFLLRAGLVRSGRFHPD